MRAITLWQPWASLIECGHKTIETRKHNRFKGLVGETIAIHASARRTDEEAIFVVGQYLKGAPYNKLFTELPRGVVVCTARVVEARWLKPDDASNALCPTDGLFGLVLADIQSLGSEYPQAKGSQGIWTWNAE